MDKTMFRLQVHNVLAIAKAIVSKSTRVETGSHLAEMAKHDPELARLLRAGVESRVACSRAIIAHIESRQEKKSDG